MRSLLVSCLALASCATASPDPVFTELADIPVGDADDAAAAEAGAGDVTITDAAVDGPSPVDLPVTADSPADTPTATPDVQVVPEDVPSELDAPAVVDAGADVVTVPDVSCARPWMVCGGACVDLQRDAAHCGTCGRACLSDERCNAGRCEGPTGYRVVRDDPGARWVDACAASGHQTVLVDTDNGVFRATLPFRFRYWGVVVDEGAPVQVTPNGYLTFQGSAPTPENGIIPNTIDGVNAVIAAQWRDLRTRSPGVCIALIGNTVGSRRWVIQWSDARYFTSALGHLNFQIALNEGSHAIDLAYDTMTLAEPSTVALENWDGTRSSVPWDIPQPITFSNRRVRFVPQ